MSCCKSESENCDKIILKAVEDVIILSEKEKKVIKARIDTGASMCSIDENLAKELKLGPKVRDRKVKSATGRTIRPVFRIRIKLKNREFEAEFTVIDRSHMKYPMLIGRNILKQGFLVDVS